MDMVRVYREQLTSLCRTGEQPRAVGGVAYHPGVEIRGGNGERPRWRDVSVDPVDGVTSDRAEQAVERLVGGQTLRTPVGGGAAESLRHAVASSTSPALFVTDQRLLVVELHPEPRAHWDADRAAVDVVAHRRHWLQAGRLEIGFSDGSMVRLVAGLVLARRARRLVRAWHA